MIRVATEAKMNRLVSSAGLPLMLQLHYIQEL